MSPSVTVISNVHMFHAHDGEKCSSAWFNHMHRREAFPLHGGRRHACFLQIARSVFEIRACFTFPTGRF